MIPEMLFPPLFLEGSEQYDFTVSPDRMVWVEKHFDENLDVWPEYHVVQARMDHGVSEDGSGALVVGMDFRRRTPSVDQALNIYCSLACRPADSPELRALEGQA